MNKSGTNKNAGLGTVIKAIRGQRRMSQTMLADFAGVHRISIARLEAGTQPMKIDTLVAIAGALGCTVKIELVPTRRTT